MATIYLLKYNNYYNRIVKKEENLGLYLSSLVDGQGAVDSNGNSNIIENFNFIEGNYINTSVVVNWVGGHPDYLVVSYDGSEISSRWFVTNVVKENFAQCRLSLQRDVVVDNYDEILSSPAFIEKGIPLNTSDSSIYNTENMSFNQIKTAHEPIKDELGVPWVVGYIPQNAFPDADKRVEGEIKATIDRFETFPRANWILYPYIMKRTPNYGYEYTPYILPPNRTDVYFTFLLYTKVPNYYDSISATPREVDCVVQVNVPWDSPKNYKVCVLPQTLYNVRGAVHMESFYGDINNAVTLSDKLLPIGTIQYLVSDAYAVFNNSITGLNGVNCKFYTSIMDEIVNRYVGNFNVRGGFNYVFGNDMPLFHGEPVNPLFPAYGSDLFTFEDGITRRWSTTSAWRKELWPQADTVYDDDTNKYNPSELVKAWNGIGTGKNIQFSGSSDAYRYEYSTAFGFGGGYDNIGMWYTAKLNDAAISGWMYCTFSTLGKYGNWYAPSGKVTNTVTIRDPYDSVNSSTTYLLMSYKSKYDTIHEANLRDGTYYFTIPKSSTRNHLAKQPYDMFCIPITGDSSIFTSNVSQFLSAEKQMQISLDLGAVIGSDNVYDVQIVPYCPFRDYIISTDDGYKLDTKSLDTDQKNITYVYQRDIAGGSDAIIGMMLWGTIASFSFKIESPIQETFSTIQEKKIANETQFYRIVSPNGSAMFDFNAAKNDGLNSFNVDVLYTPYTPYLRVTPDFGGLYNRDFNDFRGMLISDDLSLPQTSSAWTDYQVQNKNYQLQYNRQVDNLEISQGVERVQQKWEIEAGKMQAQSLGYQYGSSKYMGWGGLSGEGDRMASQWAGLASAAGQADYNASEVLRSENLNYMKDMFSMQMQNIQALPNTITKGNILSPNFQYFPILEKYECTGDEIAMLIQKLRYSGYTINRISTFSTYSDTDTTYIQGYLIRYLGNKANFAMIDAINKELKAGVYLNEYTELST